MIQISTEDNKAIRLKLGLIEVVFGNKFNNPYVARFAKVSNDIPGANHVVIDDVVVPRAPAFLAVVLGYQGDCSLKKSAASCLSSCVSLLKFVFA